MGRIIAFTGFAQSGKDSAAAFLIERGYTRLAFADILRQSLYNLNPIVPMPLEGAPEHWARVQDLVDWKGWDVAKVECPEIRELLQRMGTEVGRELYGTNFWVDMAMSQMLRRHDGPDGVVGDYVITDCRFPNEEQAIHRAGGLLFRIERPGTGAVNPHASEAHVLTMPVDGIIVNDGDLARYERKVLKVTGA